MNPSLATFLHTGRRRLALAAVPLALVIAGCGAAPATSTPAAAADAYAVAGTAFDAPLDRVKVNVGVTTTGSNAVTIPPEAIQVVVDSKAGKGSLHLALPVAALGDQAASLGALGVTGDTLELDAIFDGQGLYVKSPLASKVLPLLMLQSGQAPSGDLTGWIKLGTAQELGGLLGGLGATPGGSPAGMDELKNLDPAKLKEKLDQAGVTVTYVGSEQRNGVDAEHLTLTVDPKKLAASDIGKQLPSGQLGQIAGAAGSATLTADVWLDKATGRPAEIDIHATEGSDKTDITVLVSDPGDVALTAPAPFTEVPVGPLLSSIMQMVGGSLGQP
jgi:hypothetical protein